MKHRNAFPFHGTEEIEHPTKTWEPELLTIKLRKGRRLCASEIA